MKKISEYFIRLYALWNIIAFIIGFYYPQAFLWFTKGSYMTYTLALVMLCMGLTLKVEDFTGLFRTPKVLFFAAFCQFSIMPLLGWAVASLLHLPVEFAVGIILLACCPAGMASNLLAYLAGGHLALSVTATTVSTLLAIVMTPLLMMFYAGHLVDVNGWSLFFQVLQLVFIPVIAGVFLRYKFKKFVQKIEPAAPVISTWAIIFISGGIIAPAAVHGKENLVLYAGQLTIAATLLHASGYGLGYIVTRLVGYNHAIAKTLSFEVGLQNAGLGAVLARNSFPHFMPLVAVPAVFCGMIQTIIGGTLSSIWRVIRIRYHKA